jgi:chromosome segregation ATPase
MDTNTKKSYKDFEKLEALVYNAIAKLKELKKVNDGLRNEIGELRRLHALSEKKAERLKGELAQNKAADPETWQIKEKNIKQRLQKLKAKLSAFEKSCTSDN